MISQKKYEKDNEPVHIDASAVPTATTHDMLVFHAAALLAQHRITVPLNGALRIVHVSDVHYHPEQMTCSDVPRGAPCTHKNTTQFLQSVLEKEQPDLVAFTGDIIDGSSTLPKGAMDDIYGVAIASNVPWAASLGNHDEEASLSRDEVLSYVASLEGTLTQHGPVANSPGNFYVDVQTNATEVVARLVFFDSRLDGGAEHMINDAQLAWFEQLTLQLPAVPTLAFYHVPLRQYQDAIDASVPISGQMREPICNDLPNLDIFPTLKRGGVVAGFCGHDHANDFCAAWEGVQLCYEGSPGFTAYGKCDDAAATCYKRRVRVTELQLDRATAANLESIRSWKRVDAGGSVAAETRLDDELLWSADEEQLRISHGHRQVRAATDVGPRRDQPPSDPLSDSLSDPL